MDFARKQLEKYGWTEGSGIGKTGNSGISTAIKPNYKTGKEGLGFDLSKDLVDTWWTRAYSDSLKRLKVSDSNEDIAVRVSDDEEEDGASASATNEMTKMRKRMYKSNFTDFSKGATLTNGELVDEAQDASSTTSTDSGISTPTSSELELKLTDEELFKACGGRTAHKAARFGHKLSGKLARLAAQEAAEIKILQAASTLIKLKESKSSIDVKLDIAEAQVLPQEKIKKKKRRKYTEVEVSDEPIIEIPTKKSKKGRKKGEELNQQDADMKLEVQTQKSPKTKSKRRKHIEEYEETEVESEIPPKKKSKRIKDKKQMPSADFE